jgi:transposase
MPSNNSKYNNEFRERTCKHILESGKSATSVGEELGVDKNTICAWVRQYRKQNKLPSYAESKDIKTVSNREAKVVNAQNKLDRKRIMELEEEIEILKKALRIFTQAPR